MKGCVLFCEYEIGFLLEYYILADSGALHFKIWILCEYEIAEFRCSILNL